MDYFQVVIDAPDGESLPACLYEVTGRLPEFPDCGCTFLDEGNAQEAVEALKDALDTWRVRIVQKEHRDCPYCLEREQDARMLSLGGIWTDPLPHLLEGYHTFTIRGGY